MISYINALVTQYNISKGMFVLTVYSRRHRLIGTIVAVLLVGLMFVGTCMPALAADITIEGTGRAYKAVKLLNLTTSHNKAGDGYNYSYSINDATSKYVLGALADMGKLTDDEKAAVNAATPDSAQQALIEGVKAKVPSLIRGFTGEGMTGEARAFADYAWERIEADGFPDSIMISATGRRFADADQGYYLIAETEAETSNDALSLVMLDTLGQENVEVTAKESVPEMTKKMIDADGNIKTIDDFAVGDTVTYELRGTLPGNYERFKRYKYVFHDTMGAGLTLNADSVKVYLGDTGTTELTDPAHTVSISGNADDCSIEVGFANLKDNAALDKDSIIRVRYTATVAEGADRGNPGNKNKAHLEFSTDPYYDGDGTDEPTNNTPDKLTTAITYDFIFNKVDEAGDPLTGALFALQKQTDDGGWEDMAAPTGTDPQFIFGGKDVGTYRLIETKVPDGYMPMQDIIFTVEATFGADKLTALTVKDKDGNAFADNLFTVNLDRGSVSADIKNSPGTELPGTGGSGVYGFYITGAVLVLGALTVVMVAKRKKKNTDNT